VEIQHREAQAWLAYAEKKRDQAVTLMRSARISRIRPTSTR
jgi:hypothetical protein